MSRKLAPWYTVERWQKPTAEESQAYEEVFGHKPYRLIYKSENGTLFSKGHYPTKRTPEELPSSFIFARLGKLFGYYDASQVIGAAYKPNTFVNHLFRDDALFLSFSHSDIAPGDWESSDIVLYGWYIVSGVAALDCFSSIPKDEISGLQDAMAAKVRLYQKNYPDEHDCIGEDTFWERLESEKRSFQESIASSQE